MSAMEGSPSLSQMLARPTRSVRAVQPAFPRFAEAESAGVVAVPPELAKVVAMPERTEPCPNLLPGSETLGAADPALLRGRS